MKFLNLGSIGRNLTLLVMLAVLPSLAIFVYSGMEQRSQSIEKAKSDVQLIAKTMAELQKDLAISSRQTLSTLSLLPEIQSMNLAEIENILKAVLERNPDFKNIALVDTKGVVLVSGLPSSAINLKDRKHVREALAQRAFAVGEYIMTRVGTQEPAFAFAYPVLDKAGDPKGVLTLAILLSRFSRIHNASPQTENTFLALTDHQGIRLYYYPPNEETNPVGKAIRSSTWEVASNAEQPGQMITEGSDGTRRIFAFEQIRLTPTSSPYIYVWAGIPEAYILKPANIALTRNIALMFLVTFLALYIAWSLGKQTFIQPITNLVELVQKFGKGELDPRHKYANDPNEFETLTNAFYDMAEALSVSQELLRGNEARFRLIMDSLDAFVYVADMESYEILFINEYGKKVVGDITGKVCWQSIQEGQVQPCEFCTNKFLLNQQGNPGDLYTWEFQNTLTGRWFYIHDRAIKWVDGRVVRLEIATDISEMKAAEEKLAQETERLAVTLRSIGDGVITTNTSGEIILINDVAEQLTGWDTADAVGQPLTSVFNIINGDSREACENPAARVMASGKHVSLEEDTILVSRDGEERNIADSAAPIKNEAGEVIGVVLVFRDITEQIQTEKELAKVTKLESIGVLAGGIAHDFNNILTAILGNIDLSLSDPVLSKETRVLLSEAEKASKRAQSLTGQLLTFSKGGEPIIETASLMDVVKDSAEFVLHGDKVALEYDFSEDLGFVDIDKGQISQVIQNIILNARDAMPDGGMITVRGENINPEKEEGLILPQNKPYVKLHFKDNGKGMTAEVLERIFDPYFSTKKDGSGLGLAITHSIINKHQGQIKAHSVRGEGTSFLIYLPVSEQTKLTPKPEKKVTESQPAARIMILDDEPSIRDVTGVMLKKMGHEVTAVETGEDVIHQYQQAQKTEKPFDLVILDLTIPGGMGGKETINKLQEIDPEIKAIVSSGYSNDPVMANYKDFGFSAAIVKPYLIRELSEAINQIIE